MATQLSRRVSVGAVAAALVASCGGEAANAQVGAPVHAAMVPESPCGLLSAREVTAATGIVVGGGFRVRAIGEDPGVVGSICEYTSNGRFGVFMISYRPPGVPPDEQRRCDARTPNARSLAEHYRGGGALIVCVARGLPVQVSVQNGVGGELTVLTSLAQALLDRFPDSRSPDDASDASAAGAAAAAATAPPRSPLDRVERAQTTREPTRGLFLGSFKVTFESTMFADMAVSSTLVAQLQDRDVVALCADHATTN